MTIITKLTNTIKALSHKKHNWWITGGFLLSVVLIKNSFFGQTYFHNLTGASMIDMSFINTKLDIVKYLSSIGHEGREAYIILLILDFILIITFFLLQSTLIARQLGSIKKDHLLRSIIYVPAARGILDVMENCAMLINTINYPSANNLILLLAGIFTFLKWVTFIFLIAILLTLITLSIANQIKNKRLKRKANNEA